MAVKTPVMSHAEKRARRQKIAKAVSRGRSIADVAQSFEVGIRTVYDACREFGVEIPDQRRAQE